MIGPGISHSFDDFNSPKFISCWNLHDFTEYNENFKCLEDFNMVQVTTFFQHALSSSHFFGFAVAPLHNLSSLVFHCTVSTQKPTSRRFSGLASTGGSVKLDI